MNIHYAIEAFGIHSVIEYWKPAKIELAKKRKANWSIEHPNLELDSADSDGPQWLGNGKNHHYKVKNSVNTSKSVTFNVNELEERVMKIDFPSVEEKTSLFHVNYDDDGLLKSYVPSIGTMIDKGYAYRLPEEPNFVFVTIPSGLCCYWAFASICRDTYGS